MSSITQLEVNTSNQAYQSRWGTHTDTGTTFPSALILGRTCGRQKQRGLHGRGREAAQTGGGHGAAVRQARRGREGACVPRVRSLMERVMANPRG